MRLFALPQGARFSNKELLTFIFPIIFETLLVACLGMADTLMVSSLGETFVAGVALVNRIDNFAKQFLVAMAQGGCVILAQYIGAENQEKAQISMKEVVRIITGIALIGFLILAILKRPLLHFLYGTAEPEVLAVSMEYFTVTVLSYPFCSLYYCCTNAYRVMGESRIPFLSSVLMMSVNLLLKYLFIFHCDMGVFGAALSTLIAMALSGLTLSLMLMRKSNKIRLVGLCSPVFDWGIGKKILKVSIPNGLEQGMFQLGALAIAGLVASLGTSSIAADQIARNISPFIYSCGSGFAGVMLMAVGQCMGARDIEGAKLYTRHILKLDYLFTFVNAILLFLVLKPVIGLFQVSKEAQSYAYDIMVLYIIFSTLFYPTSFAVPSSLRGAGDTGFVMWVSTASMFLFRIAAAYFFVHILHMGVLGTWVAMILDWVIRSAVFYVRFLHGKWQGHNII